MPGEQLHARSLLRWLWWCNSAAAVAAAAATSKSPCLSGQGSGKWTAEARAKGVPRGWKWANPVGEGTGCGRSKPEERVVGYGWDFESCPLEPYDTRAICQELAGRELVFVGDSVQVHLFLEFHMMLNHTKNHTMGMCKHYTCRDRWICTQHVPGGVKMKIIRDDWLSRPGEHGPRDSTPKGKKPLVHENGWMRKLTNRSVAVITPGSHFWLSSTIRRPQMVRLAAAFGDLMKRTPGLRVVFRSAMPGHRNCTAAKEPLASATSPLAAQFWPSPYVDDIFAQFGWWDIDAERGSWDDMFRKVGIPILEVWTPSSLRPDMHPPKLDKLHKHVDCLHYCPGEPVYYAWALTLANMIQAWGLML